ncbi:hypothetical protein HK405_007242, partial [Cladochytrium tenue]
PSPSGAATPVPPHRVDTSSPAGAFSVSSMPLRASSPEPTSGSLPMQQQPQIRRRTSSRRIHIAAAGATTDPGTPAAAAPFIPPRRESIAVGGGSGIGFGARSPQAYNPMAQSPPIAWTPPVDSARSPPAYSPLAAATTSDAARTAYPFPAVGSATIPSPLRRAVRAGPIGDDGEGGGGDSDGGDGLVPAVRADRTAGVSPVPPPMRTSSVSSNTPGVGGMAAEPPAAATKANADALPAVVLAAAPPGMSRTASSSSSRRSGGSGASGWSSGGGGNAARLEMDIVALGGQQRSLRAAVASATGLGEEAEYAQPVDGGGGADEGDHHHHPHHQGQQHLQRRRRTVGSVGLAAVREATRAENGLVA